MKLFQAVVAIALAASLVVASGCSSSPTESVSETPTSTPTPTVSTPPSQQQLYEEAVGIYRKMRVQTEKIERAGGADELPPELKQYVTGYMAQTLTSVYKAWKAEGLVLYGRGETIEWIREDHDGPHDGSLVTVAVCTDGRNAEVKRAGTPANVGRTVINYYYFKYFDGVLKGFYIEYEWVESCSGR